MTCRLCHKDIPNGADVHVDCIARADVEAYNRFCMMPYTDGANETKFLRFYEFDEPETDGPCCDRCYKDEWGQGPYETPDGYICESCYMEDVSKAEYIGEGDR